MTISNGAALRDPIAGDRGSNRRRGAWWAIAIFGLTRAVVLIAAMQAPQDRTRAKAPDWWSDVPTMRWDAGHYRQILVNGYPPEITETAAFFPVYPLVTRPLAMLIDPDVALVVMSHLAALIGVVFFYLWCETHSDVRAALWGVALLCCYPPAMFFSTGYSEGVFFLLVALTLRLLDRERFWWAALVSAITTATRPNGICVAAVVVLWVWSASASNPLRARATKLVAVGLISISGLIAHEIFLWQHFGRADAYFAAQAGWKLDPVNNRWHKALSLTPVVKAGLQPMKFALYGDFQKLLEPRIWNPFWSLLILTCAIAGLIRPGRIPRITFLVPIFIFLMAYLPDVFTGGRLIGIGRYQLPALPCFLMAAGWSVWKRFWPAFAAICLMLLVLQCVYVRLFCDWILVG